MRPHPRENSPPPGWAHQDGAELQLIAQIRYLEAQLAEMHSGGLPHHKTGLTRATNRLRRYRKQLAALRDGRPWAWQDYPAD